MTITLRPARREDQQTIVSLIRQAKLNPRNLHWERFLVAEDAGQIVGVRQVRVHAQGTHEVGSGFVLPEYRGQGISARLMNEILSQEKGAVYLLCRDKWASYYEQFGFRHVPVTQRPTDFLKEYRIGRIMTTLISVFVKDKIRIIPMKRG